MMNLDKIPDLTLRDQMAEVILKNSDAFGWDKELSSTKLVTHSIPTGNAAPIVQKQYSFHI